MSGLEVAGFAVGAFALLLDVLDKSGLLHGIQSSKGLHSAHRRHQRDLFLQRSAFRHSFKQLIGGLIGPNDEKTMLDDGNSPLWTDKNFERRARERLGNAIYLETMTAMVLVCRALEEAAQALVRQMPQSMTIENNALEEMVRSLHGLHLRATEESSPRHFSVREKLRFGLGRNEVDLCIGKLRTYIGELDRVAKNFRIQQKASKRSITTSTQALYAASQNAMDKLIGIRAIQELAGPLYRALESTARCSCHQLIMNLKLEIQIPDLDRVLASPSETDSLYTLALLLSSSASTQNVGPLQDMLYALEVITKPIATGSSTTIQPMRAKTRDIACSESMSNIPPTTTENHSKPQINNICSILSISGSSDTRPYLGYVPDDEYCYLIFESRKPSPTNTFIRRSLSEVLRSSERRDRIPQRDEYELALTLSLSLLQLQSTPWLKSNFRSDDFVLFRDDSSSGSRWSPHVAAFDSFRRAVESASSQQSEGSEVRNTHILSLGIVLMELGLSEPLLSEPSSNDDIAVQEFAQACRLVQSQVLGRYMCADYARIVKTCIFWDGDSELSNVTVQKVFYKDVVCQLDHLLWSFTKGTSRLGIDWEHEVQKQNTVL